MERPGTSLLASIAVHAAVVLAVVGYGLLGFTREPLNVESAVPVSIISETVIEAAAPDNPDDELITEEAATKRSGSLSTPMQAMSWSRRASAASDDV